MIIGDCTTQYLGDDGFLNTAHLVVLLTCVAYLF